jgi:hypothetical protein
MIDLQQLLVSSAPLTSIVQGRITNTLMPQDYARPYLVWTIVSEVAEESLSCIPETDYYRIQFDGYSKVAKEARRIIEAVRDEIETLTSSIIVRQFYEKETALFRWSMDAAFIAER